MDWNQRLNAALDFLESNLDSEPDLERAAALANCSLFHFLRMFEVVFGLTPGEYSRRRRLSCAALDLAAGKGRILDVALRYGYETPEAFAKAFKRLFGLTPTEAKSPGATLETWPPLRLVVVLKGAQVMKYRIVDLPAFEVVGWPRRTSTLGDENFKTLPLFWDSCHRDGKVAALVPLAGGLGLVGVCAEMDLKSEAFTYLIGVERVPGRSYPQGTRTVPLPHGTYVVFTSVGPMPEAIQQTWKQAYAEWFPTSGYEHTGSPDFEAYPQGDLSSPGYESEIWIPIKKKL